jgi:hypothetical protein
MKKLFLWGAKAVARASYFSEVIYTIVSGEKSCEMGGNNSPRPLPLRLLSPRGKRVRGAASSA